jgi:hypothetical protein
MRALLAATALLAVACSTGEASPGLQHSAASVDALAGEVLQALTRKDIPRLQALALSESEFRTLVWPGLPASRPEAGVPVEYAWNDLHTKSRSDLQQTVNALEGQRLELLSVRFTGRVSDYGTFRVYRDAVLEVRQGDGITRRLRLFGSVIEQAGRVKVFSYVVD